MQKRDPDILFSSDTYENMVIIIVIIVRVSCVMSESSYVFVDLASCWRPGELQRWLSS